MLAGAAVDRNHFTASRSHGGCDPYGAIAVRGANLQDLSTPGATQDEVKQFCRGRLQVEHLPGMLMLGVILRASKLLYFVQQAHERGRQNVLMKRHGCPRVKCMPAL